jgi:misacylated tRNA(Ala) deacylase
MPLILAYTWLMSALILPATQRLYLQDDHCFECNTSLLAVNRNSLAFDRTCFYPGSGGQPPDQGWVSFQNDQPPITISTVHVDESGIFWHICQEPVPELEPGQNARLGLDIPRRMALMRYHTVLHILNTIALREYKAWITGVQIGTETSRIDFNFSDLSLDVCRTLEEQVNRVIQADHNLRAYTITEEEFHHRPDLLRTLDVRPPIQNGKVRVVEITGFDAQACGGTHVHHTSELGYFSILRTENKGRNNKRLYVQLGQHSDRLGRGEGDG